jgi:hypothetical protein
MLLLNVGAKNKQQGLSKLLGQLKIASQFNNEECLALRIKTAEILK